MDLVFKPEYDLGNLITISSVLASLCVLGYAWIKDRQLRKKEYADKIRNAAGTIIAKLERRKVLSLSFFEDIQPLTVETDKLLVKERSIINARDFLWLGLVKARSSSLQRIMEEQIEIAYRDLYGYDPRIQALYVEAINRLVSIDKMVFNQVLILTQENVLTMENVKETLDKDFSSSQLGNLLRSTLSVLASSYELKMDGIIAPFRDEMMKLIEASDGDIVDRKILLSIPEKTLPES